MRRTLVFLLVPAALLLGWLLLSPPPSDDSSPRRSGGGIEEALFGPADNGAAPADRAPEAADAAPGRTDAALGPEGAPGATGGEAAELRIRVLDPDGVSPAPGAALSLLDPEVEGIREMIRPALREMSNFSALAEQHGQPFRAGADGTASFPLPGRKSIVTARSEAGFGVLILSEPAAGQTLDLLLVAAGSLLVEVRGPEGEALAGVPVVLLQEQGSWSSVIARSRTEGDPPLLRFRDLVPLLRAIAREEGRFAIELPLVLEEAAAAEIDPAAPPEGPVRFTLPPTGSVVVEAFDALGQPVADGTRILLRDAGAEGEVRRAFDRGTERAGVASALTEGGIARFPFVALERELVAAMELPGFREPTEGGGFGPMVPGREVRLRLQPERGPSFLVGRVLDPEGEPLRDADLTQVLQTRSGGSSSSFQGGLSTDGEGRFRLAVRDQEEAGERTLTLGLQDRGSTTWLSRIELDLAPQYPPGETDLGDLRLLELGVLARGTVLGHDDAPLARAMVSLARSRALDAQGTQTYWQPDFEVRTLTDEEGAFLLRGEVDPVEAGPFALQVFGDGHRMETVPLALGQSGLVIRLSRACELSGQILVDAGIDSRKLEVLWLADQDGMVWSSGTSRFQRDGSFSFENLEPRPGRLVVKATGGAAVLAEVGLTLEPGPNRDPRLDPLDLRGRLREVRLTVVDEAGRSLPEASITGAEEGSTLDLTIRDEREARILTTDEALHLRVTAPGFLVTELRDVRDGARAVLRRAAELQFLLEEIPALPAGKALVLNLRPEAGRIPRNPGTGPPRFDEQGALATTVPQAGVYTVLFGLQDTTTGGWSTLPLFQPPATVEVLDPGLPQTFRVRVDPAGVAAALEGG